MSAPDEIPATPKATKNKGKLKAFVLGCDPTAYDGPKTKDLYKHKAYDLTLNKAYADKVKQDLPG